MTHPFLRHEGPIVYAHRGGGAERPENSTAAFAHAMELGLTYLETDARLTADGVLMALHDDRLDRVSDGRGLVRERTAAEVASYRLRQADGTLSDERVPVLEDLLVGFPTARFNLDAKELATVGPLGDLIERLGLLDRCCVGAFSDDRLRRLRRRFGPELCTTLGPIEVARLRAASFGLPVGAFAGSVVQVPLSRAPAVGPFTLPFSVPIVDRRLVAAARRRAIPVHVWTINAAAEMHRVLDMGVDGFMTDAPSVAVDVLRARDQGHGDALT